MNPQLPVSGYEAPHAESATDLRAKPGDTAPASVVARLEARNRQLEDELALMLRQQEAFAHGISHDLRAPLRAIDGYAAQLQRQAEADADAPETVQTARIRAAVARMGGLIDSLLEYSRVSRAEPVHAPVDLEFLVDWTLMDIRDQHRDLDMQIAVQPGLQVVGDERLLKMLLAKVLDNSRKFADAERGLCVTVTGTPTPEGMQVCIEDRGIGMALRDPQQPFEPFQRLHSASQGAGDGLGLAIVQAIVHRHGGRVWAESMPGEGSRIQFVLPG